MTSRRLRRLVTNQLPAAVGVCFLIVVGLLGIFAPVVAPQDPNTQSLGTRLRPPSGTNWLGTDALGRDNLSRIIWGKRVSLTIGITSVALATLLGTLLGILAGFYAGNADWAAMRFTDIFMSLPGIFVITMLVALFGPGFWMTILVIGAVY